MKVLVVVGTRLEAIKMAPVINELRRRDCCFDVVVCLAAQHHEMLDQVIDIFELPVHYDLNLIEHDQTVFDVTANVLTGMKRVLEETTPDIVLVQGDTTTTFAAALASYHQCIPTVRKNTDLDVLYRVHPNPNVRRATSQILANQDRVHLIEPLEYASFVHLLKKATIVLTDSGGIQEEGPSLGKPVLVMRDVT